MNKLIPIIFNTFMFPFEKLLLNKRRDELISQAKGDVLEIGAGTGVNFDYYEKENIKKLTVTDLKFNNLIYNKQKTNKLDISYIEGNAEHMPFEDNSFDTVVATLIFCSIENPEKALGEIYRVLKPDGKLIFIEHVLPENKHCRHAAHALNSTWKKIGKCNINRETKKTIENANFKISNFEKFGKAYFIFNKGVATKNTRI